MKLEDKYTTSALMHLLRQRYGLNPLGVKQILGIDTGRYNNLLRGKSHLKMDESLRLISAFEELRGRFSMATITVKDTK
jgi:hypothetical protein